ncbi:MAG: ATP-binding cassette domain-containing protein [Spirochaetia bacterium]
MEPVITVDNLHAAFGDHKVLKGISLQIEPQTVTAIIGPSGCGKTTLLKHMLGLYIPTEGKIRVAGTELTTAGEEDFRVLRKKIGMLFQNNALMGSGTILENAAVPLEQHTSLPDELIRLNILRKLELLGIGETIDKMPSELSGGMQKRAALARAIVMDPEILFCDEPTSGLDPITSKKLDQLIAGLREKLDMTVVIVSHDVSSIGRLADKIVFLDKGSIVFEGTFDQVLLSENPVVVDFFSEYRNDHTGSTGS